MPLAFLPTPGVLFLLTFAPGGPNKSSIASPPLTLIDVAGLLGGPAPGGFPPGGPPGGPPVNAPLGDPPIGDPPIGGPPIGGPPVNGGDERDGDACPALIAGLWVLPNGAGGADKVVGVVGAVVGVGEIGVIAGVGTCGDKGGAAEPGLDGIPVLPGVDVLFGGGAGFAAVGVCSPAFLLTQRFKSGS